MSSQKVDMNETACLAALLSVVYEACYTMTPDELDTWERSSYAGAMRLLASAGYLEITSEDGTAIRAKLTHDGAMLLAGMPTVAAPGSADIEINGMTRAEFHIGMEFFTAAGRWRVTDVGTRTVIAIKLNQNDPRNYLGPPYSIAENVFDEDDLGGCVAAPPS